MDTDKVFWCQQCQSYHGKGYVRSRVRLESAENGGLKTCNRCKQDAKRRKAGGPGKHNLLRTIDKKRRKLSMLH